MVIGSEKPVTLSKAGNVYTWILRPSTAADAALPISADKKIMVAQFASSRTNNNDHSDPAMMIATPVSQVSSQKDSQDITTAI